MRKLFNYLQGKETVDIIATKVKMNGEPYVRQQKSVEMKIKCPQYAKSISRRSKFFSYFGRRNYIISHKGPAGYFYILYNGKFRNTDEEVMYRVFGEKNYNAQRIFSGSNFLEYYIDTQGDIVQESWSSMQKKIVYAPALFWLGDSKYHTVNIPSASIKDFKTKFNIL